jgi:bifunctional DNA-binding transcriptional regulator/antitoxin component of YhaV-PrlF toxin-antitoxin module
MERVFITVSSKGQMVIPAAIREELGIKRLRKKAETGVKCLKSIPQGLKPVLYFEAFAARLKSCPDLKIDREPFYNQEHSMGYRIFVLILCFTESQGFSEHPA